MIRTRDIKKLQKALESDKKRVYEIRGEISEINDLIEDLEETLFSLEFELEPLLARICAAEKQQATEDKIIYARNNPRPKSEAKLSLF